MTVFNNIQKTSVILSWLAMHVFWNTWQKYKVAVLGQGSCTKIIIRLPPMTISKEEKYLISAMSIQVALFWMTGWYWKELPLHSSQETCKYALDSCNEWHCVTGTALQKTYIIWHCITIDSTLKFIPSKQYLILGNEHTANRTKNENKTPTKKLIHNLCAQTPRELILLLLRITFFHIP